MQFSVTVKNIDGGAIIKLVLSVKSETYGDNHQIQELVRSLRAKGSEKAILGFKPESLPESQYARLELLLGE